VALPQVYGIVETNCEDGVDNDNNTFTDCDDPSCASKEHCFVNCVVDGIPASVGQNEVVFTAQELTSAALTVEVMSKSCFLAPADQSWKDAGYTVNVDSQEYCCRWAGQVSSGQTGSQVCSHGCHQREAQEFISESLELGSDCVSTCYPIVPVPSATCEAELPSYSVASRDSGRVDYEFDRPQQKNCWLHDVLPAGGFLLDFDEDVSPVCCQHSGVVVDGVCQYGCLGFSSLNYRYLHQSCLVNCYEL
jgi:hypothetical protein